MLLPLTDDLIPTWCADPDCAQLADRHYSRGKRGARQFMPNGRKHILRDMAGDVVFAWLWQQQRDDGEEGYNCSIFRNESGRVASGLILEAERSVVLEWGPSRAFTYIDPRKVPPTMVRSHPVWGFCFYKAGWHFARLAKDGKHILEKQLKRLQGEP